MHGSATSRWMQALSDTPLTVIGTRKHGEQRQQRVRVGFAYLVVLR